MTALSINDPCEPSTESSKIRQESARKYPDTFGKIHLMDLPRCGAKRRGRDELCKGMAMANGRCRIHGGRSTGPKTPEGLANSQRANWKHGERSKEGIEELRAYVWGLDLFFHPEKLEAVGSAEFEQHRDALNRALEMIGNMQNVFRPA